jgi:hypothetical protein
LLLAFRLGSHTFSLVGFWVAILPLYLPSSWDHGHVPSCLACFWNRVLLSFCLGSSWTSILLPPPPK